MPPLALSQTLYLLACEPMLRRRLPQDLLLPGMKASVWGLSLFDRAGDTSSQMPASRIYGMYTSVAYLTPMLGGLLADRYLGRQRTVMIGAALMSLGYFLLGAWPAAFLPTLMIIAFGVPPSLSSPQQSPVDRQDIWYYRL